MKKSDFIEFKAVYLDTCKKIIEQKGACIDIWCGQCPFHEFNSTNKTHCYNVHADDVSGDEEDNKLIESAKKYIQLYAEELPPILEITFKITYNAKTVKEKKMLRDILLGNDTNLLLHSNTIGETIGVPIEMGE